MNCRFCHNPLTIEFIDLFNSPASNSFISKDQLSEPEVFYPLKVFLCDECFLVQVDEYQKSESIFNSDYAYFSSYSTSWLAHAKHYTDMMIARFGFNEKSKVIEIASNDGYLLQYFKERKVPVLGIEPTKNTAKVARSKGIETVTEFFGTNFAKTLVINDVKADLLLGNNVLAHVPDINDFVAGMKIALNTEGVITMEFPHLIQLIKNNQFDTIYHEHYSYLSFFTVKQIFESKGLEMFDVEEIPTHGGSLRIFAKHKEDKTKNISDNVAKLIDKEINTGINNLNYYKGFQDQAEKVKLDLLSFLIDQKQKHKKVAAYGAAAKGNTLLNYCGIKNDFISFVVDSNPYKQNKFLPASHIPIVNEEVLKSERPDYIIIFPWNLTEEIIAQLSYIKNWNAKFVVAIPELRIF